jgi:hypothetical protein
MCVSMSDKPFDAEACDIGLQASATIGLSDMKTPSKTHRLLDPLGVDYMHRAFFTSDKQVFLLEAFCDISYIMAE